MIDIHTHILPGMDDGSTSSVMSLRMLEILKHQGIKGACLTSHFYADENSPERFVERRNFYYQRLLRRAKEEKTTLAIPVLLGAEVLYFNGMSRSAEVLKHLCYEGTNIMLLEMPFHPWSDRMADEVIQMQKFSGMRIILAHVERYWPFVADEVLEEFRRAGIRMHINCSALLNRRTRKKALSAIQNGEVQFLASDAHNLTSRAPCFTDAFAVLQKKGMQDAIEDLKARKL